MTNQPVTASQAIQQANEAFHRGDRHAARQWAQLAVSMAPQNEESWLILAAVSTPQASVVYIKQALLVNPESERALRGLRWAQDRLARETTVPQPPVPEPPLKVIDETLAVTRPNRSQPNPTASRKKAAGWWMTVLPVISLAATCLALLLITIWPGNVSRALALIHSETVATAPASPTKNDPRWAVADIVKPTYTPTATVTASPTNTFTPTATETPTALPTDTSPIVENTATPAAPIADNGKYILVSISEQHLYAYQDNQLVYSFVASTGMNNATRTGTFQVLDKIPNAYGSTWDLWMPNWMGIYYSGTLENGIHALPILSNGVQLWGGYLGTPISYGCVVIGVEEAQLLYNWAEVGTTVEIKY